MSFLLSYTLGHAQDHVSGLNIGGDQRPVLPVTIGDEASIDRALEFEKGDSLFDARHRLVVSFTAELPTPEEKQQVTQALAEGAKSSFRAVSVLPMILVSAEQDEGLLRKALSGHAFCVLAKPVSKNLVIYVVSRALTRRAMAAEGP